jgi:hypothetical protein
MCAYGSWSFNRSHAVAYGYISYWCCYLKAHHPVEFAAATLSHEADPDKQLKMLREIAKEGVNYVPIDPERSTDKWNVHNGKLIGPLSNVRGIGPKLMRSILSARAKKTPMPTRAQTLLRDPITTIDELYPFETRFNQLVPDPKAINIVSPLRKVLSLTPDKEEVVVVAAKIMSIAPRDQNDPQKVAKRGYRINRGQTWYLNMIIEDDTDKILASISRYKFLKIGKPIMERGDAGNVIYAFKGKTTQGFRMLHVDYVRFIGLMKDKEEEDANEEESAGVTE